MDLETLTRLLFCADGLTRQVSVGGQDYHFRAAPSAGALYPVEIYLVAGEVEGLDNGLYHFSPADLKLHGLRRGNWRPYLARAAAMRPSISQARAILIMSAIFWRSAWKYRARAYRYCYWDTGTMLANLLAAASAEALHADVITGFEDAQLEALIDVDGDREGLMCMVALGRTSPASGESPESPHLQVETIPLSPNEVIYDDLIKIHRATRLGSVEEVQEMASARVESARAPGGGKTIRPELLPPETAAGLGETILRRGSTRRFAREAIGADELATIMAASSSHPTSDNPSLTHTYLIVNAVEGLDSGAYYYRRRTGEFELIKRGDFRREAGYLSLEQTLGADCSALVVYMADLELALRALGNRAYRLAHLEAGLLGGRAYLAAYALQRGATGLTFYDDDTTKFFEPHATGMSPLLMVGLGVPRTRPSESDAI
jgi:SagB-type dehydrogenase family enzyme